MKCLECRVDSGNFARCPKCGYLNYPDWYMKNCVDDYPPKLAKFYKMNYYSRFSFLIYALLVVLVGIWALFDNFSYEFTSSPDPIKLFVLGIVISVVLIIFISVWLYKKVIK